MGYYRKRPVVVFAEGPIVRGQEIDTLEGTMRADPGDYIITGVKGERYPCKPDIFAATYEAVADLTHATAQDRPDSLSRQVREALELARQLRAQARALGVVLEEGREA
jgi:hypothetical protein